MNRNWVGKRKLFFHSWWQRGKPILSYGKVSPMQKRRMKTIHTIRVATSCALDASPRNRNDGRAMKISWLFIFLGFVPAVFAAEAAQIVFINGNIETVNERQ